jgi:2',3'-cyclic-nucleotide 2'-phosphodiesterase (5'-nucleotidase family)
MLFNTGDTIQGSAEALYTSGQAQVDILNAWGIDAFAPGNWDYVYGTARFLQLFGPNQPVAPWHAIAANLYYSTLAEDPTTPFPSTAGQRVLAPYVVRQIAGLKIGILGFTNNRGPQVVGTTVTKGFKFTSGDAELDELLPVLRNTEHVDLVFMLSELGLANNIRLAEAHPGVDLILSSDMHEETTVPVVTSNGTLIVEEGQDGTQIGELQLKLTLGGKKRWTWTPHVIDDSIAENAGVAQSVAQARHTFITGPDFVQYVNPFNGSRLLRPIDQVVGYTQIPLYRGNFSQDPMPGVIEGSSHDFLTDAFRAMTGANIGAIRGFRYGTHVAAGPIKVEDLYHFIPIGPQIAMGTITGQQLKSQIENAANGSLDPNVANWTGGWLFNFSGVTMTIDPFQPNGQRSSAIQVNGQPLVTSQQYTYASYWYAVDPNLVNVLPAQNIFILRDLNGDPLDGTEVVARYLQALPNQTVNPQLNRIQLASPLPAPLFGFPEIQPLRGAQ